MLPVQATATRRGMSGVPCSTLSLFKEDFSQAAVRVVEEATDNK
jgi:hypothetical protein